MALTQLDRTRWHDFFDAASQSADDPSVTLELVGLEIGDRIAADHTAMAGISYEPLADTLTLFLQGLEHRIEHPQTIHLDESDGALTSFQVIDAGGVHHIVQFHQALAIDRSAT